MLSSVVLLLPVFAAALSAPLTPRQSTVDTCVLQLDAPVTSQIRHSIDTRSRWTPWRRNVEGEYESIAVNTFTADPNAPAFWVVEPVDTFPGKHKVRLNNDTIRTPLCASGSGSGSNSTVVNFVDCSSDYALWTITCETCQSSYGGECQFAAQYRVDSDKTSPQMCASVPSEQDGDLFIKKCNTFTEPRNYEQLFYFGVSEAAQ
ncbi:hypothetical protein JCM8547_008643 [Rhodosporidiobolus lusitaniae]